MYKTVLIDLDDTLWATQRNNKEAIHELYLSEGWSSSFPSFDAFWADYYPYNESLWHRYRHGEISKMELTLQRLRQPLLPVKAYSDEELLAINDRFLRITSAKSGVVEGAIELLEYLKTLYQIVIVSNGFVEVQHRKMASAGLTKYVDVTVLSEDVGVSKPYKGIFDKALSLSHTRRGEAIMIGDSWDADIIGAQNSRLPSIWFNPNNVPFPMPQEELRYPVYVVHKLDEIPSLLRKI